MTTTKTYRLLGADGQPYESPIKGDLGGNSRDKIYGNLTCGTAIAAIPKGYAQIRVFFADEGVIGFFPGKVPLRRKVDLRHPEAANTISDKGWLWNYMASFRVLS